MVAEPGCVPGLEEAVPLSVAEVAAEPTAAARSILAEAARTSLAEAVRAALQVASPDTKVLRRKRRQRCHQ